jgi:uncharacterized protein (TIGR02266 family)
VSQNDSSAEERRFQRAAVTMEVHYRTTGSFLVSYSLNLSMGGLFLETDELLPTGTRLAVRFAVPGAVDPVETSAHVVWVRPPSDDGAPPGLGLQFDSLEEHIGALIDRLVRDFRGVTLMAVAADVQSLDRLSRYLRSILACEVKHGMPREIVTKGFGETPDLILLDLDSTGPEGFDVLWAARANNPAVPVVVATANEHSAADARRQNVARVVGNPPAFELLRRSVLEVIASPSR